MLLNSTLLYFSYLCKWWTFMLLLRLFKSSSQIEWNLWYRISLVVESQLDKKKFGTIINSEHATSTMHLIKCKILSSLCEHITVNCVASCQVITFQCLQESMLLVSSVLQMYNLEICKIFNYRYARKASLLFPCLLVTDNPDLTIVLDKEYAMTSY